MRFHPTDGILYLTMRLLKAFDRRQTDLKYFAPNKVKNILVVSSTAIGDTLLSTPAIRAVREQYPEAKIIGHFNIKNMELFENNSHIDRIIPYYGGYKRFFRTVREFRKHKFDLVLIFHGNEPQATPMAYLSGARFIVKIPIPKQYGFLLSNTNNIFENPWEHHAVDVRLKTAFLAGCRENNKNLVLILDKDEVDFIDNYLKDLSIKKDNIVIGFQMGAAKQYKAWPEKHFIELGKRLLLYNSNIRIVMVGSRNEKGLCDSVAKVIGKGVLSVAGKITLKQLSALVKKMQILVTNDTGTMHIAIALNIKTVSLFCPTNYWGVGPIQDIHLHKIIVKDKPCNPCITKKCKDPFCMELIRVDEVFASITQILNENSPL
jgi:ADP-heptose:LPS heptosyltransferase